MRFNRTFMELKYLNKNFRPSMYSFNRTFMELKLINKHKFFKLSSCFNRTFMELKLPYIQI